jgi:thymidine kinase
MLSYSIKILIFLIIAHIKNKRMLNLLVFLSKKQVLQLTDVVDILNIPVLAYGLRSDFQGEPFEGTMALLVWADNLVELKTICHCGKKAINNARMDVHGNIIQKGEQIFIGANESYVSMCRKHFKEAMSGSAQL